MELKFITHTFQANGAKDFFFFHPPPSPIVEQPTAGAALHLLVYVTACTEGDGGGRECVCRCAFVCGACVCVNRGLLPVARA